MKKLHVTKKKKYISPKIVRKKIKLSFFYSNSRFQDSLDDLLNIGVYAQSGGCGGSSCSKADVCFLPETEITLYDGTRCRIDQITRGAEVLSYDPQTQQKQKGVVLDIEHHIRPDGYYLINNILKITDDHPVWVNNKWISVKDIKQHDSLLKESGEVIGVDTIEYIATEAVVYNIRVDMSYFAEGILVNSYWKE